MVSRDIQGELEDAMIDILKKHGFDYQGTDGDVAKVTSPDGQAADVLTPRHWFVGFESK